VQENHYYPFGMNLVGIEKRGNPEDKFQYNGKEKQEEFGLNAYDYGARFYSFDAPRWWGVDALAEKYHFISPYVYVANNPVIFIDPNGKDIEIGNLNAKDRSALKKLMETSTGRAFVAQYARAGDEILGVRFEETGRNANNILRFNSKPPHVTYAGSTGVYLKLRNTNNQNYNEIDLYIERRQVSEEIIKEFMNTYSKTVVFEVNLYRTEDRSIERTTEIMGHEMFLHIERIQKQFDKMFHLYSRGKFHSDASKYNEGSEGKITPEFLVIGFLSNIVNQEKTNEDHKLFVDGKAVSMNEFLKELNELYKK
jgi:RHS repeat-associated protein